MSCWLEEKKKKMTTEVCVCLPQISCGSYSYGVSQPCSYFPSGHFFKERPSRNRRVKKSHNPVTRDDKGRAGNWVGSIKLKSNTSQDKIKTVYKNFLENKVGKCIGVGDFFIVVGFFSSSSFLFFCSFSYMQDCCFFVETIPRNIIPENTWTMVIYDNVLWTCTTNQLK